MSPFQIIYVPLIIVWQSQICSDHWPRWFFPSKSQLRHNSGGAWKHTKGEKFIFLTCSWRHDTAYCVSVCFLTENIFQRQGLCVVLQISSWSAVSDLLQNNGRWQRGVETTRPGSAAPSMSDEETPYCQQPEYASSSILVCSVLQTRVGLSKCLAASWWHGIVGPLPP